MSTLALVENQMLISSPFAQLHKDTSLTHSFITDSGFYKSTNKTQQASVMLNLANIEMLLRHGISLLSKPVSASVLLSERVPQYPVWLFPHIIPRSTFATALQVPMRCAMGRNQWFWAILEVQRENVVKMTNVWIWVDPVSRTFYFNPNRPN